ncbi:MAG: hypothetical protein M3M94_02305, partial [Actinomycetota bacterium]|nr:hypothetical protein [Actinomycetota bacterium]
MAERRAPGRKRLLVLGAGAAQLGILEAARARGLEIVTADRDPDAIGVALADHRAVVSAEDEEAVERVARDHSVDALIAAGIDWPVRVAAAVAERLALPHPLSSQAARAATSKLAQRETFEHAGVPQPRWQVVRSPDEVTLAPPFVVKAPDRQGQRGLGVVRERAELAEALGNALAASRSGACLVEELIEGPELTVNAFSVG